jgi:hypothetical protein
MNCREFNEVIVELARNPGAEDLRAIAMAHLSDCYDCEVRLEDQRYLTTCLTAFAQQMEALEAGPQIERNLLLQFRNQLHLAPALRSAPAWKPWVAAAAAVLLLIFSVVAVRLYRQALRQPAVISAVKTNIETPKAPKDIERLAASEIKINRHSPKTGWAGKPHARDARNLTVSRWQKQYTGNLNAASDNASPINSEIATDFFPVGDGSGLGLEDGGQLVRVELPRSALVRFGLPVNMDRANERVKADVLVGVDGLARAIRFVK